MSPNRPAVFYILNMILMVESLPTSGTNLRGQMFTLSRNGGGVSLYPPPGPTSSPTKTRPLTTAPPETTTLVPTTAPPETTTPVPTTASPRGGVSVCLRYIDEYNNQIFTLSPYPYPISSNIILSTFNGGYKLSKRNGVDLLAFSSFRKLWPNVSDGLWTSVCVTVDCRTGVVQVFRGGAVSIRKRLRTQYEWTGPPVIDISSDFEGQLTDVQVWSSSLSNHDVFLYMTYGYYGYYRGSVLTWFDIGYSLRGNSLLEEAYGIQGPAGTSQGTDQPIRGRARESARRIEKRRKKDFRKQGRVDAGTLTKNMQ